MKVALVTPSYFPHRGALERRVDGLAGGLARRGVDVEVLTQDAGRHQPRLSLSEGVVVRRFAAVFGDGRPAVTPALWDHLRRRGGSYDVIDAQGSQVALALAVAHAGLPRFVFTPHAPSEQLIRWSHRRLIRVVLERAVRVVCTSNAQANTLCRAFGWSADRMRVVTPGVDVRAIRAAEPFRSDEAIVLAVGRLERDQRMDRAIAAMAGLGPGSRLVVVGEGPARRSLQAYAADLRVSARVAFAGAVPDAELYRWLRTAHVVVTLGARHASGTQVLEALAAGVPVVASDVPAHREAALRAGGQGVVFVSREGSPLEVADAISEAAHLDVSPEAGEHIPSLDAVVDTTAAVYDELVRGNLSDAGGAAVGLPGLGLGGGLGTALQE
jgi:glycosyltransferase involved in cell wall biosynthesis